MRPTSTFAFEFVVLATRMNTEFEEIHSFAIGASLDGI
jgi:hypothetical protein